MVAATVTKGFFENSEIYREVEKRGVKSCRERYEQKKKKMRKRMNESEFFKKKFLSHTD